MSSEWISVQEKLPDNTNDVLMVNNGHICIGFFTGKALWLETGGGEDFEDGPALRSLILERHGRRLMEMLQEAIDLTAIRLHEVDRAMAAEYATVVLAIDKTLDSPIDNSDKIAHLREQFPKGKIKQMQELLEAAAEFDKNKV